MPAKFLMSWDGKQRRWDKMHKGERYRVFCSQLGIPETEWTKDGSYQAANKWWQHKLAELSAAKLAIEHHDRPELPALEERKAYTQRHGLKAEADIIDAEIISVKTNVPGLDPHVDPVTAARMKLADSIGVDVSAIDPTTAPLIFGSNSDVWADRLQREKLADPDRTIGTLAGKWISDVQEEARRGVRSVSNSEVIRRAVGKFVEFAGPSNSVDAVNADLWQRWYLHCATMATKREMADGKRHKDGDGKQSSWSADTTKKFFGESRRFVRQLWMGGVLKELPRNLDDRRHKFASEDKDPATFKRAEITALLSAAPEYHRLLMLLSLNCGMYSQDIADLRKNQIRMSPKGTTCIVRRRSKTRKKKGVPKVYYRLWPETAELLTKFTNADPAEPRALVTKGGKPWCWWEQRPDGTVRRSDNVATIFNNLRKKIKLTGPDKSFKVFRKTSATFIRRKEEFAKLRHLFLGHKAGDMSDRHYAKGHRRELDRAILWLRRVYFRNPTA